MPKWVKVVIVVVAILFVLAGVAAALAVRWIKRKAVQLQAQGEILVKDAHAFGQGRPAAACVDDTFVRLGQCDGFICEAKTKVFLTACLGAADVPPDFCATVPRRSEILRSATWAAGECAGRNRPGDQRCTRVIAGIQDYCERPQGAGTRRGASE
jgi:hypothetical protein